MARAGWLLPMLLIAPGCIWPEPAEPGSFMKRLAKQTISPDSAVLRVALIEKPAGAESLHDAAWQHVDELTVDEDCRERLRVNGFRVGILIGAPSSELQRLLTSRSYCKAKDSAFAPDKVLSIPIGPPLPVTTFAIAQGKTPGEAKLENARYCLEVSARCVKDRTHLTFTPRVEHGAPRLPFQVAADQRRWEMCADKACRKYPELAWELTLGENEYCLIGGRPEWKGTIGHNAFLQGDGPRPTERLLVIINCRVPKGLEENVEEAVQSDSAPLALQASVPTLRK